MRSRRWIALGVGIAVAVMLPAALLAQEHPAEHPKEHPAEHPKDKAKGVTKEELGAAITAYIQGEMKKGGGTWMVKDAEAGTELALTLDKVHMDKLATTAKHTYFACADLKGADGHMYDLDVFMKGPDKASLKVTEVTVHKKDGVERYTWMEEGGVWKKVKGN